jgi:hypothetical protein
MLFYFQVLCKFNEMLRLIWQEHLTEISIILLVTLEGDCGGTSQVITSTYSCPCPTDLRQLCRCT